MMALARAQMQRRSKTEKAVRARRALHQLMESRELVVGRAAGRCERCGDVGSQAHHRRPRMSGGSTAVGINAPSNLVWLCHSCHVHIESKREDSREAGWLLSDVRHAPRVAIYHHSLGWVRLLDDGSYEDATDGAA